MKKISILPLALIIAVFVSSCSTTSESQSQTGKKEKNAIAVIAGNNHVYTLTVPAGWNVNSKFAKKIGLPAPFYINPNGIKDPKETYIYSYGYHTKDQTLESFILNNHNRLTKAYPEIVFGNKGDIVTQKYIKARLYGYKNFPNNHIDHVAYLKTNNTICVITYSTGDKENYHHYLDIFRKVVKSFRFLTTDVNELRKEKVKVEW